LRILRHHHVAHVRCQASDEVSTVESLGDNTVEQEHDVAHLVFQGEVYDTEIVLGVEHVKVFEHLLQGDVALTIARHLVEDRQGIAHASVCFLGNNVEGFFLVGNAFAVGHHLQVVDNLGHCHALKVVNLAAREDGGQYFVFLGGGEDEDDMLRRLLEGFQKSVESRGGEHVHLVDDEYLVPAGLRRNLCLFHQGLDVFHRIVARCVKLKDVHRASVVERAAALALIASLSVGRGVLAIDGLGEDAGTGSLAHSARPAEEISMGQFPASDSILQRCGQGFLPHHGAKGHRTVFSGRYYVVVHNV